MTISNLKNRPVKHCAYTDSEVFIYVANEGPCHFIRLRAIGVLNSPGWFETGPAWLTTLE